MKVVHEGGPWTQSRQWSMDWGGQCYVYTLFKIYHQSETQWLYDFDVKILHHGEVNTDCEELLELTN